ncbi:hypothetical protein KKA15_06220 [Patescibacteria group bacterium]|nr:hypothetical protein [Patescibacteria group bacterium]
MKILLVGNSMFLRVLADALSEKKHVIIGVSTISGAESATSTDPDIGLAILVPDIPDVSRHHCLELAKRIKENLPDAKVALTDNINPGKIFHFLIPPNTGIDAALKAIEVNVTK